MRARRWSAWWTAARCRPRRCTCRARWWTGCGAGGWCGWDGRHRHLPGAVADRVRGIVAARAALVCAPPGRLTRRRALSPAAHFGVASTRALLQALAPLEPHWQSFRPAASRTRGSRIVPRAASQVVVAPPELHWQSFREPGWDGSLSGEVRTPLHAIQALPMSERRVIAHRCARVRAGGGPGRVRACWGWAGGRAGGGGGLARAWSRAWAVWHAAAHLRRTRSRELAGPLMFRDRCPLAPAGPCWRLTGPAAS